MKKHLLVALTLLFLSCFTEPKKKEVTVTAIPGVTSNSEVISDTAVVPILETNVVDTVNINTEGEKDNGRIQLETFEKNSDIYSRYDGCGCYFSIDKDNFIVGKKNVFFGEIFDKKSTIELIIDGQVEKLTSDRCKLSKDGQIFYVFINSKYTAVVILEKQTIEEEESVFLSGSININNKYFSTVFGRCGC